MRRFLAAAVVVFILFIFMGGALPVAQQPPQPPQPTFRAEINYVEMPVRVLDAKGNFVRDLKPADFQVFEDGKPQQIAAFGLIDLPLPVPGKAGSAAAAASPGVLSVAALEKLGGRLYLFVVDDYHILPAFSFRTRQLLQSFIKERMGPTDAAAILFTSGIRSQDFTQNRQALLSAVDRFNGIFNANQPDVEKAFKARSIVKTVTDAATVLGAIKGRHKALIFVTPAVGCSMIGQALPDPDRMAGAAGYGDVGPGADVSAPLCGTAILDGVRAAARADVSIYSIDPRGLQSPGGASAEIDGSGGPAAAMQRMQDTQGFGLNIFDGMHVLADETGGFVLTGTNAFNKAFDRIVAENTSYYVIGYYASNDKTDGTLRKNTITVDRSGLQVLYRAAYVAPHN
jgi:VWFA-related protein